jgi:hypothetical protein
MVETGVRRVSRFTFAGMVISLALIDVLMSFWREEHSSQSSVLRHAFFA